MGIILGPLILITVIVIVILFALLLFLRIKELDEQSIFENDKNYE